MAADQYCLKWNNHQSTLLVQFETLLESDSLTDCTLSAEGKYLNVHKVLLSACSPYFSKLLGEHKDKHPIFFMKDVAFEELKGIVEYMYKGEVNVMQERLDSFLKTASSLQIKGLADQDGGKGEDREEDPGGGRAKRKQAPDLRGGYGESSPMPEEPPRSPKRRRRPRPVSQDDSLPAQDQNHCDTTTAPAFSQLQQQEVVMPTPLVPVKKTEPVDNSMVHLKTEIPDDVPQVDVQDLTLDDDEDFNNEDITQPGTSFSETSQDFAQWQQQMATQSGADESFMAASQGINQSGSQGVYLCFHCSRVFTRKSNLIRHQKNSCFKSVRNVNCPFCPAIVGSYDSLRSHIDFVHPKKDLANLQTLSCKWCTYKTKFSLYLDSHLAEEHPEETSRALKNSNKQDSSNSSEEVTLECCYCSFRSDSKSSLLVHQTHKHPVELLGSQSTVKGQNEKEPKRSNKIRCSYCSFTAESEQIAHNHEYMKHPAALLDRSSQNENNHPLQFLNSIKCSYCSFLAENQKVLDAHQYMKHPVELLKKNLKRSKTDKD